MGGYSIQVLLLAEMTYHIGEGTIVPSQFCLQGVEEHEMHLWSGWILLPALLVEEGTLALQADLLCACDRGGQGQI